MADPLFFAPSRPVVLVPHQVAWAREFIDIAQRIRAVAGAALSGIDHIGSTAVPGLVAKDVLDIQLRVAHWSDITTLTHALREVGFQQGVKVEYDVFHGLTDRSPELRRYYMREPLGERRMHLHIREAGRFNTRYALLFRDYLRAHAPACAEYGLLKSRAAAIFPHSINGYLFLKEPVFHLLYHAAELWAATVAWTPEEAGN
jgi:dephospho-CoA kinase